MNYNCSFDTYSYNASILLHCCLGCPPIVRWSTCPGGGRYSDISKWVMQWVRVRIRVRDRVRAMVRVTVTVRVRVSVRNCRNRECRNRNLYPTCPRF